MGVRLPLPLLCAQCTNIVRCRFFYTRKRHPGVFAVCFPTVEGDRQLIVVQINTFTKVSINFLLAFWSSRLFSFSFVRK